MPLLFYTGEKAPIHLQLRTKSSHFVVLTWNISDIAERDTLIWTLNHRVV